MSKFVCELNSRFERYRVTGLAIIVLAVFAACTAAAVAAGIAGDWEGESICTIKSSPCHDEHVIYHVTEPDAKGAFKIRADKVVNGTPEDMATLDCTFDKAASVIKCPMDHGLWEFSVTGDKMKGTLTLPDGRLYRNISVTRSAK